MFAAGGTLLIVLGLYGFIALRLEIGVFGTLLFLGVLLFGWQFRNSVWGYRSKQRAKSHLDV
jgi:hypothetical protein